MTRLSLISSLLQEPYFLDTVEGPLLINGHCAHKRMPVHQVHSIFREAKSIVTCPVQDLTPEDWESYHAVVKVRLFPEAKTNKFNVSCHTVLHLDFNISGLRF